MLNILLTLNNGIKIVSVNAMYRARIVNGHAVIYKTAEAKNMCTAIRNQLLSVDFSQHLDWIRKTKQFSITQNYILKSTRRKSTVDCGNCEKAISDAIVKYFREDLGLTDFDDSQFSDLHLYKSYIPKAEHEYVLVNIRPSHFNMRFDDNPKPSYIFLGGTCAGINWREELIPELKNLKIKYFNPLVDEWTEECRVKGEKAKEECDTDLYLITPDMKGVYSIAEMVDAAYRRRENGFCYVGFLGTEEEWGEAQWESLKATVDLINKISNGCSRIKAAMINNVKEVLEWMH